MEIPIHINSDNKELLGIFHKAGHSKATVLIINGLGGNRVDIHKICTLLARKLEENHISCIRIDYSGSGISEGNFIDFTFEQQKRDVEHIIEWFRKKSQEDIYLLGFSDGAFIAYEYGYTSDNIKGVIFWSPNFIDGSDDMGESKSDFGKNRLYSVNGKLAWPVLGHWVYKDYFTDRNEKVSNMHLDLIRKKSLIVYGETDEQIRDRVRKIQNDNIEKNEIKNANHLFLSPDWTDKAITVTLDWLERNGNRGYLYI